MRAVFSAEGGRHDLKPQETGVQRPRATVNYNYTLYVYYYRAQETPRAPEEEDTRGDRETREGPEGRTGGRRAQGTWGDPRDTRRTGGQSRGIGVGRKARGVKQVYSTAMQKRLHTHNTQPRAQGKII